MNSWVGGSESIKEELTVDSADGADLQRIIGRIIKVAAIDGNMLAKFQPSRLMGAILIISGIFHLTLLWITGEAWAGPLSLRKPGLFGISAGVTVWSIAWILTQVESRGYDRLLASCMSSALLLEVGLITLQTWRGVPSHFNHATPFDAIIEFIMLGLILLVTVGIAWLCWRSFQLRPMHASLRIAIRGGLWLLLLSCGLGFLVTIAGEVNLAQGQRPEIWGRAGVLKYPHGAVLHAIQTLPLLSGMLLWFRVPRSIWLTRAAVAAHVLFLTQALWQTFHGRARMDVDAIGGVTLMLAGLLIAMPLIAIACRLMAMLRGYWFQASIHRPN